MIKDEYKSIIIYIYYRYTIIMIITYYEPVQDRKMRNRSSCFFLNGIMFISMRRSE